jgi:predicted RNase H-like HicB family nuclease
MKWASFLLMIWCWGLLMFFALCQGCATFSNRGKDLTQAMATAEEAKAVARAVCEFNWNARECYYLVHSLQNFYELALVVQDAKAQGHDVSEAVQALEELSKEILGVGQLMLKRVA